VGQTQNRENNPMQSKMGARIGPSVTSQAALHVVGSLLIDFRQAEAR